MSLASPNTVPEATDVPAEANDISGASHPPGNGP